MWIAIRQFDGALVAGQRKKYMPGDAVPEASGWQNPKAWRQWITQVPDAEVVNGRWTRYEEVMLRGAKPAAKPEIAPAPPTPQAQPTTIIEPTGSTPESATAQSSPPGLQQTPSQTASAVSADEPTEPPSEAPSPAASSEQAVADQQTDGEKPRRRRRGAITS